MYAVSPESLSRLIDEITQEQRVTAQVMDEDMTLKGAALSQLADRHEKLRQALSMAIWLRNNLQTLEQGKGAVERRLCGLYAA